MLVAAGLVTESQVLQALERQRVSGRRLGEELVAAGFVSEVQLTQIVSNQLSVPWVSLYHVQFSRELLNLVPSELAEEHGLIPIYVRKVRRAGDTLFIAMDDPTKLDAIDAVAAATGMPVKPMVAPPSEIQNAIRVYYLGVAPLPAPAEDSEPEVMVSEPTEEEAAELAELAQAEARDAAAAAAPEAEPAEPAPKPKKKKKTKKKRGRMITITLLDGTSVRLPAPNQGGAEEEEEEEEEEGAHALTASDLVQALVARAQGADVSDVLPNDRWELVFATLLRLLIRKGLVADWEFVEEWKKTQS